MPADPSDLHSREAFGLRVVLNGAAVRNHKQRSGFTLLELMVVLAIIVLLSVMAFPSFSGLKGNADQKAAADELRARIADARGLAMQESVPYRLAVSTDGTKVRVAPDTPEFATTPCSAESYGGAKAIETILKNATVTVAEDAQDSDAPGEKDAWFTVATFLPNGTCRESGATVEVKETSFPSIRIHLRGLTGTASVVTGDPSNGGMK